MFSFAFIPPPASEHQVLVNPDENPKVIPKVIQVLRVLIPDMDLAKLELIQICEVVWNNGALGCPLPGHYYTQALVPGYLIEYLYEGQFIEIHSNQSLTTFAVPGLGYIPVN